MDGHMYKNDGWGRSWRWTIGGGVPQVPGLAGEGFRDGQTG
jgi:hypothetical protein